MKQFDRAINKKLEERDFPLNEQHLASFEALLDKKPKRRVAGYWWFGIALLLLGAGVAIGVGFKGDQASMAKIVEPEMEETSLKLTQDLSKSIEFERSEITKKKTLTIEKQQLSNDNHQPTKNQSTEQSNNNEAKEVLKADVENYMSHQKNQKFVYPTNSIERDIMIPPKVALTLNDMSSYSENTTVERELDKKLNGLQTLSLLSNFDKERVFEMRDGRPTIVQKKKGNLGLVLNSGLKRGHAGLFLQIPIRNKFSLFIQGGMAHQWDDVEFEKTSVISRPGFGARNTTNTLQIKKLYQSYGAIELGYRFRKHLFIVGGRTSFTYGAKGDLTVFKNQDFGGSTSEFRKDVWLSTSGINKLSFTTTAGYSYPLTNNLQLGVSLIMPLRSSTGAFNQEQITGYLLDSRKEKISAAIDIRYYLFKF